MRNAFAKPLAENPYPQTQTVVAKIMAWSEDVRFKKNGTVENVCIAEVIDHHRSPFSLFGKPGFKSPTASRNFLDDLVKEYGNDIEKKAYQEQREKFLNKVTFLPKQQSLVNTPQILFNSQAANRALAAPTEEVITTPDVPERKTGEVMSSG